MEFVYFTLTILLHTSSILSPSVKALHIIHFKAISGEMKKMIQNAEYPSDDPRQLHDLEQRQRICDEVLKARQYFIISYNKNSRNPRPQKSTTNPSVADNFQQLHGQSENALPIYQDVSYHKNYGRWETHSLPLVKCLDMEKEWFVGFDQNNRRAYLVERIKYGRKIIFKWIAVIENRSIQYDVKFLGPEKQERVIEHFTKEVIQADIADAELQKCSLCFLSINEHGRLCSAIAESLDLPCSSSSSSGLPHLNYIRIGQQRCVTRQVEGLNNGFVTTKVIRCIVNENRQIPQFYVLRDRKIPGAAYVLQQKADKLMQLKVVDHFQDLNVLLEIGPEESAWSVPEEVINYTPV